MNKDNQERLIAEASKIRDVNKRRKYFIAQGLDKDEVDRLIDLVHFRTRGRDKFPRAAKMRFTRDGLAMASGKAVAEYRTWKIRNQLGTVKKVLDVGAGIGGDTIAMALRWKVVSVENSQEMVEILKHNIGVYGVTDNVALVEEDITRIIHEDSFKDSVKDIDVIFFDPSRRSQQGRTVKTEEYIPPLDFVLELLELCTNLCVKISPGTDIQRIKYDCDIEVVSNRNSTKEVVLWFGELKQNPDENLIMATKLPEKITLVRDKTKRATITDVGDYIYEPDPAFIKAWLVDTIADKYNVTRIHPTIPYLTGDKIEKNPLLKAYKVLTVVPNKPETINDELKRLNIGRIDFKARGVNVDMKNIHRTIRGKGKRKGLVILTRVNEMEKAVICSYS